MDRQHMQNFRTIDPEKIDDEILNYPELLGDLIDLAYEKDKERDEAKRQMDKAKVALDETKADLLVEIRSSKDPERYGLDKFTDATVEAAIKRHKDYKLQMEVYEQAIKVFNDAKNEASLAHGDIDSIKAKKDSLEQIRYLAGMDWFAPSTSQKVLGSTKDSSYFQKNREPAFTSKGVKKETKRRRG